MSNKIGTGQWTNRRTDERTNGRMDEQIRTDEQKSIKIVKNHIKIQIYEFRVPQLLVLRDSNKIWKNSIFGPKLNFSVVWGT